MKTDSELKDMIREQIDDFVANELFEYGRWDGFEDLTDEEMDRIRELLETVVVIVDMEQI